MPGIGLGIAGTPRSCVGRAGFTQKACLILQWEKGTQRTKPPWPSAQGQQFQFPQNVMVALPQSLREQLVLQACATKPSKS